MILSKGPRKARQLPLCGLKTLAAIIYLHGQICFPIWKKIHHGKNIHLQLWLLVGDQTNTNYPPSVSDSISSGVKRHQIAASRQYGFWKKFPWKKCNFWSLHWHAIFTISTGIRISQPKIIPHNNDIIDQRNGAVLTILQRHLMEGKKIKTFCHNFLHFAKS